MAHLFQPYTLKSLTIKNKLVTSPMCMYMAQDGLPSDWHLVHYGTRAIGGCGIVMVEATAVTPEGRISVGDTGIWDDKHIAPHKRIASFIKSQGAVPAIQIAHAGRKGSFWVSGSDSKFLTKEEGGWDVIAPSTIPFNEGYGQPIAMTQADIHSVQEAFVSASQRALAAGYEMIEIHGAHGYLINSFLSPLINNRTDEYGGSRDNRARFLFEIIDKIKKVWPADLPIAVRISATEWVDGGWDIDDSVWLAQELEKRGIDILDVSSGGSQPNAKIPVGPSYQLPLARAIKANIKGDMLVGTVGMITSATQAETILLNQDADVIFIARELLRNPYFPIHAAKEVARERIEPKPYERGF